MSNEKARLLIRGVANQLPNDSDLRRQLEWADEILANSEQCSINSEPDGLSFPLPVFRRYKGKLYNGQLLKGWKIRMNGKVYESPSAAAVHISGHPENGWRTWRYIDESTNEEMPIAKLRER